MAGIPEVINTWQMTEQGKGGNPGKLTKTTIPVPELAEDDVLVEIAGCGVCHTDLGFFYDGVPTVNKPPLTLGHEIAGTVVAGKSDYIGKNVIIPAVMPCNNCPICDQERGNRCLAQKMPGNSLGVYGGFSSHIPVPSGDLCVLDELKHPLSHYAVIADAATTPYQAAMRADLKKDDLVVVTGVTGGVGVYMAQIAKALGAKVVVGIARNQAKLDRALSYGTDFIINSKGKDIKEVKGEFAGICKQAGVPKNVGWKIFECTGSGGGQEIALSLISFLSKMVVVGFGLQPNKYMLSKLMAFDAEIIGTWGCLPKYYNNVLAMVHEGKVEIEPFLETKPMSTIEQVFEDQHAGKFDKRQVLEPDF
ncbi:6-hydroxycyclohex-1-ene-1-carbonyl-CoA dehydrogenase [Dethiosulfatarculus sandiegensis]|uniref:6-hydroxycyclohex-1-ene-1-carbonyl-CoA dehydrogenase n=1 Tax=Dethiosulfatarculus sandiegensis TaxID=1429043 RepID=UPI0006981795|nr:6-hydroxycyclohex-1-ene-1-carbonyl-CoA dehydrogenase [Dethiosulfatarculus sandiegensis]